MVYGYVEIQTDSLYFDGLSRPDVILNPGIEANPLDISKLEFYGIRIRPWPGFCKILLSIRIFFKGLSLKDFRFGNSSFYPVCPDRHHIN